MNLQAITTQYLPVIVFVLFVLGVLGLSFYFARRTRSAAGYYAAGGTIHWSVNGVAFAGDYLSAASFLGICGMIATVGYDGFLYSIGYLAGWVVALFVVAEPMKRLGKYTFTDALDARFNHRGIQLAAAISTLVVSIFYLIPQMVGAGVLVTPLLGLPHAIGVILVGSIVIIIVATAGMTSTTYVQFIKGGLLVVFSLALSVAVLWRGLSTEPAPSEGVPTYEYKVIAASEVDGKLVVADPTYQVAAERPTSAGPLVKLVKDGVATWWKKSTSSSGVTLNEVQFVATGSDGARTINGAPASPTNQLRPVGNLVRIEGETGAAAKTGPVGPFEFLAKLSSAETAVRTWKPVKLEEAGQKLTIYVPSETTGNRMMRPGLKFKVEGTLVERLDFISLMLALFLGTAALPHILIRYYTVPNPAAARKSTIVAIAVIGFFYVLTLYMGLGALTGGVVNPADNNMSAPLLARSFGNMLFAVISAIAFATVLGTVAGLIVAASGAVAHDLLDRFMGLEMPDHLKVRAAKLSALGVGVIAIVLGIIFQGVNVTFLVGLAFAVAASANLPSVIMLLFWKRTTPQGIVASILVGVLASIGIILFSPDLYELYGLPREDAPVPFANPGLFSIPASWLTLVVVSLMTFKEPLGSGATVPPAARAS